MNRSPRRGGARAVGPPTAGTSGTAGTSATATALVLLALVSGCAATKSDGSPSDADRPAGGDADRAAAARAWLGDRGRPIALEGEGFEDLSFLEPLLDGRRIVQLGENTHGTREYNLLKARIVRYLHQELGYDVLAFESALYQCFDADARAAEAPARTTLLRCAFGVWHTEGVLPLFEYLRETRRTDRPLRLAGIDIQPIGSNKEHRPAFLAGAVAAVDRTTVDAGYAAEVAALDSSFLEVYARGGGERRAFFRSADGRRMAEAYDRLADFLARTERSRVGGADVGVGPATTSPGDGRASGPRNGRATREEDSAAHDGGRASDRSTHRVARQTARSMARYIRQQASPTTRLHVERRDEGMARNLIFLLDELYPDGKIVVWGHNFHVRHDNLAIPPDTSMFPDVAARTMGAWIRERYGDRVYTVGLYAYRGRALNNAGEAYEIGPAGSGGLEALLHGTGAEALFVDLSRAPDAPATAWMAEPVTARYDGTTALRMVLRDQYDAILFVDEVTPRAMLY